MEEMRVYIANLGKYNESELVGEWFTPPIDFEEVKERIGLNDEYEEYAIHDYELPFDIGEYTSIEEINRLCALVSEINDSAVADNLKEIISWFAFTGVEELAENQDDINFYDCSGMEELAECFIDEGYLGEIPDRLRGYIDVSAFARDLETEGSFLVASCGIFEYAG